MEPFFQHWEILPMWQRLINKWYAWWKKTQKIQTNTASSLCRQLKAYLNNSYLISQWKELNWSVSVLREADGVAVFRLPFYTVSAFYLHVIPTNYWHCLSCYTQFVSRSDFIVRNSSSSCSCFTLQVWSLTLAPPFPKWVGVSIFRGVTIQSRVVPLLEPTKKVTNCQTASFWIW